jgi:hypothetical protein
MFWSCFEKSGSEIRGGIMKGECVSVFVCRYIIGILFCFGGQVLFESSIEGLQLEVFFVWGGVLTKKPIPCGGWG